ncbi:MAG: septal ring lytic transglycosylase RlpA family protein [Ignavibacteria bacterium]
MKTLAKSILLVFMVFLLGFTIVTNKPDFRNSNESRNEDDVIGATLVNYIDKGKMLASWYGPRFHGKRTANGEIYDQMALTAAHKTLKFGTLLRVTNPKNNKSVIVRINDRGPYIRGRQLDLSKGAALELDILDKGIARVNIEQVSLKGVNFPIVSMN